MKTNKEWLNDYTQQLENKMRGIIESVTPNSSGKSWSVYVDGKRYMRNKADIQQFVGKTIDFEAGSFNNIDTIESFGVVEDERNPPQQTSYNQQSTQQTHTGDFIPDRFLAMTSNILASAIAMGAKPGEYKQIVNDLMAAVNKP